MNSTSSIRPWQFYMTASFLGAAAAVWLSPPSTPVAMIFISLAIGAAGACASALHALLTSLGGRRDVIAEFTEGQRIELEREKLLALRSIKDLQFDAAMGKISAADAAPMETRLRERAAGITRELDSREQVRLRVERDLAERQATGDRPQATGLKPMADGLWPVTCAACATANDVDAKFCKACGGKL